MLRKLGVIAALLVLVWLGLRYLGPKPPVLAQPSETLLSDLRLDPATFDKAKVSLRIEKSKYRLTVLYGGQPIRSYRTVFGPDPVNDKRREGDNRTPEGHFKVRDLYPHRSWTYFIWIDYPTAESWQKHRDAKAKGEIPPEATIGGEIGIHGTPLDSLIDLQTNWTAGCISVKNRDITEIYQLSQVGTPVEIVP